MARHAPTLPITPKMLRHFAVATVTITGMLALFADGESREAIENQLTAQKEKNAVKIAERDAGGKRSVTAITKKYQNTAPPPPVFGGDGLAGDGGGFGSQDAASWREGDRMPAQGTSREQAKIDEAAMGAAGIPSNKPFDQIEAARRKKMLEKLKRKGPPPPPTAAQTELMLEKSRARSGGLETIGDS